MRIVLFGCATLIGLLVCEGIVRLAAPEWSDQWKMWRIDPIYARGLRPDVRNAVVHGHSDEFAFRFSTNSLGLRMDREPSPLPEPGGQRVLVVGDSFAFGYGVDQGQTFSDVVEHEARRRGQALEVLNAGFASGFGLDTEYLFTREVGADWRPSRVIAAVCLSNDLADLARTRWRVEEDRLEGIEKHNDWVPVWLKRSGVVNLVVKGAWPALRDAWRAPAGEGAERVDPCTLPLLQPEPLVPPLSSGASESLAKPGAHDPAPESRVEWILAAWSQDALARGYALQLLLVPDAEEVEWATSEARLREKAGVRSVFVAAANRNAIDVLEPLPAMRAHACSAAGAPLYFERDGHLNPAGHRFIGHWLATRLAESHP